METNMNTTEIRESDFFRAAGDSAPAAGFIEEQDGNQVSSKTPADPNAVDPEQNDNKSPRKMKSEQSAALNKAIREIVKVYETINNHDELSQVHRDRVRELISKQSTALDMKLNGQKPEDGEDFDALSKALRKENNKLDALLEGEAAMYKKFHTAFENVTAALNQMHSEITKMEDES